MDEKTRRHAPPVASDHEDQVEALRMLVDLIESGRGKAVPVRVACDDGTIREIDVGGSEAERLEVVAVLRRHLRRILH